MFDRIKVFLTGSLELACLITFITAILLLVPSANPMV